MNLIWNSYSLTPPLRPFRIPLENYALALWLYSPIFYYSNSHFAPYIELLSSVPVQVLSGLLFFIVFHVDLIQSYR
jgi:hypothetical protein